MNTNQIITEYLTENLAALEFVYFFGSRADGHFRDDSDFDIAVFCTHPLDSVARWEVAQGLARELKRDVDLVDLHSASTVLRFQVVTTGNLLLDSENRAAAFDTTTISMYQRLNEGRKEILDDFLKEITNG